MRRQSTDGFVAAHWGGIVKMIGVIAGIVVAAIFFVYGSVVGEYKLFPYQHLKRISSVVYSEKNEQEKSFFANFTARASQFSMSHEQADVVMLGDSITANGEWAELLRGVSVVNRGIAGDTTTGILSRMDGVYQANPKKVFLLIGVNDLAGDTAQKDITDNYRQIVSALRGRGVSVYALSVIYCTGKFEYLNGKISQMNKDISRVASESGSVFVDLNAVLAPSGSLNMGFTEDGLHMNGNGYRAFSDQIQALARSSQSVQ